MRKWYEEGVWSIICDGAKHLPLPLYWIIKMRGGGGGGGGGGEQCPSSYKGDGPSCPLCLV